MVARQVIVHGKVQGVFFRASARDKAVVLGLSGKVGNRADGSVELWLEGEREAVEDMTDWCRKGPSRAEVERIEVMEKAPEGYTDFRIER
jgi:acylphosphatase